MKTSFAMPSTLTTCFALNALLLSIAAFFGNYLIVFVGHHFPYHVIHCLLPPSETIAINATNCSVGVLTDGECPKGWICAEWWSGAVVGRCLCHDSCPPNQTIVSTIRPLPIYSDDDNNGDSNSRSVIILSVFGVVISAMMAFMAYYMGVRKGMFREIWRRAFTPQQMEHQLLDRSPHIDDNNDSEAIA
ncbi:unnamed protein product [Medioppia subpectinata]|uniref:Uncharacterized protein n=1 Tax=Medioppia subpectinata TaxID=1979941 RepID=A0A7R9Q6I1_9ACAR|nr:unnamed protein product [Medioppia subpectinata]CAG2114449.1 unnamed protein product [Medioppia subpectinata]